MDTLGYKELIIFDILYLFYGVLLGFYAGICNQCNYGYLKQQGVQYTAQDNGMKTCQTSRSIVQTIKYDRSDLLSWAKYRKLSGFSNEDRKEQNGNLTEGFIMNYCVPYQKRKYSMKTLNY